MKNFVTSMRMKMSGHNTAKDDQSSIKSSSLYTNNSRGDESFSKSFVSLNEFQVPGIAESSLMTRKLNQQSQFDEDMSFAGVSIISRRYDDESETLGDKNKDFENITLDQPDVEKCLGGVKPTSQTMESVDVGESAHEGNEPPKNPSETRCSKRSPTITRCLSRYRNSSTQFKLALFVTGALFCVFFIMLAALLWLSSNGTNTGKIENIEDPSGKGGTAIRQHSSPTVSLSETPTASPVLVGTLTTRPTDPSTLAPTEPPTLAPTEPPTLAPTNPPTLAPTAVEFSPTVTDECVDSEDEFLFHDEIRDCLWLSQNQVGRFILCHEESPVYSICTRTCDNCPSL